MTRRSNLTERRKRDHLGLFRRRGLPETGTTTWLEHVLLVHQALPELGIDDLDVSASFCGRKFHAPFFITGMTGGTGQARKLNRVLACAAEERGVGFGLGSQRAMLERPRLAPTYEVRSVAPDVFLAGNIGGVQAGTTPPERLRAMLRQVGADALCVHLNPAQEMVQPEGDRAFSGVTAAIAKLVREARVPVIVKETGAGLSRETAGKLRAAGVRHLDVAGAGGTSFAAVEVERRRRAGCSDMSEFRDWGIPTAAALLEVAGLGFEVMASGGIRSGLDAARAIALGADICGVAAPIVRAYFAGGLRSVRAVLDSLEAGLKTAMVLTGSRTLADLRSAPRVIAGDLLDWQRQRGVQLGEGGRRC